MDYYHLYKKYKRKYRDSQIAGFRWRRRARENVEERRAVEQEQRNLTYPRYQALKDEIISTLIEDGIPQKWVIDKIGSYESNIREGVNSHTGFVSDDNITKPIVQELTKLYDYERAEEQGGEEDDEDEDEEAEPDYIEEI